MSPPDDLSSPASLPPPPDPFHDKIRDHFAAAIRALPSTLQKNPEQVHPYCRNRALQTKRGRGGIEYGESTKKGRKNKRRIRRSSINKWPERAFLQLSFLDPPPFFPRGPPSFLSPSAWRRGGKTFAIYTRQKSAERREKQGRRGRKKSINLPSLPPLPPLRQTQAATTGCRGPLWKGKKSRREKRKETRGGKWKESPLSPFRPHLSPKRKRIKQTKETLRKARRGRE